MSKKQRLLGVLGGMSWESTTSYYQEINRRYHAARGGYHSAPMILHSVNFAPIEEMQRAGAWQEAAQALGNAALGLERAGAGMLLLATNTMHIVFDTIAGMTTAPWIHIADPAGDAIVRDGHRRIGLLGTRFTMEQPFYHDRLASQHGLEVIVPSSEDRSAVDRIIFEDLVHGITPQASRERYRSIMASLADQGAEAIIFGCTEIGLLVTQDDSPVPVYDTTELHAESAVAWLLSDTT